MNPGNNNLFPLSYILLLLLYNIIIIILVCLRIFSKALEENSIIIIFVQSRVVFFTFFIRVEIRKNEMIIRLLLGLGSFLDGGGCWLPLFDGRTQESAAHSPHSKWKSVGLEKIEDARISSMYPMKFKRK